MSTERTRLAVGWAPRFCAAAVPTISALTAVTAAPRPSCFKKARRSNGFIVRSGLQPREQPEGILTVDHAQFRGREVAVVLQPLADGGGARGKREVGPEEDVSSRHKLLERRQRVRVVRLRRVVIHL